MKTIIVSGTPGTGKTTLAKKLAKRLNFYYVDVNKIIFKHKLSEGYDRKRKTKIIDIKELNKFLINFIGKIKKVNENAILSKARSKKYINEIKTLTKNINKNKIKNIKGIIIDSHLSHYLPRKYADFCIITKCGIKELSKRLKKKKFSENKIKENLQAEIFGICYNEALEGKHNVIAVDTTKGFNINEVYQKLNL